MDSLLADFCERLENYLNRDEELARRLKGFKTFAGIPDGHYARARREGVKALVRAVRCYPFGGKGLIKECDLIGIYLENADYSAQFSISRTQRGFSVTTGTMGTPYLSIKLSRELFKKALLGRYRWIWLLGMNEVVVHYTDGLPHSDWITILEILVAMQELAEFNPDVLKALEQA